RNAVALEGRVHRRDLGDAPREPRKHLRDAGLGHGLRPRLEDIAFGVAGRGPRAQARERLVFLVLLEERAGELGRLAEEDDEEPRGERVERAGVAGLACAERAARLLERRVGAQAERLVEEERPIDRPGADRPRSGHSGSLSSSSRLPVPTARSMRRESRSPRSTDSSYTKRSSGVVYICRRCASCRRRKPAAALSPSVASAARPSCRVVKKTFACEKSGETSTAVRVTMPTRGSRTSRASRPESSRWIWSPSLSGRPPGRPRPRFTAARLRTDPGGTDQSVRATSTVSNTSNW